MAALALVAILVFTTVGFAAPRSPRGVPAPAAQDEPELGDDTEGGDQEPPAPGDDDVEEGLRTPGQSPERAPAFPSGPRQDDEEPPAPAAGSPTPTGAAQPVAPAQPLSE